MKTLICAALLLSSGTAASAQTAPAVPAAPAADGIATVYDKALGTGWENYSWAKTELSTDVGPRKPIKMEAQGYGGLFLHHAPFSTAPYRAVTMLIQVIGAPAKVRVIATVGGKAIPDGDKQEGGQPVAKMKLVELVPGGWKQVVVPLSVLGAENATIDGVMVQNDSNAPAPNIYVADVAFKP